MKEPQTKLHFTRFEFKYLLGKTLRQAVESELRFFLDFDPFVESLPHQKYFVRSLYFDDPFYSCYFDKLDGLHSRHKFRVRTYSETFQEAVPNFLEVKGRYNNLVYKHRVAVLLNLKSHGEITPLILKGADKENKVLQQFQFEVLRKKLQPIAVIDYLRRPYISKYDPDFRITFDDTLTCTASRGLHPSAYKTRHFFCLGQTVLEIKFKHHIPSWFHRIIQSYELRCKSFSKICHGLQALGMSADY